MSSFGEVSGNLGDINSAFHTVLRDNLGWNAGVIISYTDNFTIIAKYKPTSA